jgi:hypothetical protein
LFVDEYFFVRVMLNVGIHVREHALVKLTLLPITLD